MRREPLPYWLNWLGGELQLEMSHVPGTLTVPDAWALKSLRCTRPIASAPRFDWGVGIDAEACDLKQLERLWATPARRHKDGAVFFISRPDGVELAIQLDWMEGWSGRLSSLSMAALGVPKGDASTGRPRDPDGGNRV